MFAYDEICRIAGKICKAYVHRVFVLEHGFCNGTKPGILVCDYHYFPVVMAYPLQNGNVKIVECIDDKEAWEAFSVLSENGSGNSFVRRIETGMWGYTAILRNFRAAVCNELNDNGVSGDAEDFLMDTSSEVIMEDAMRILTRDHDVSLDEFNRVFGSGGGAEKTVESNGFEFKVNGSDLTDEEIESFAGEAYTALPLHLKGLCYGVVEVKPGFTHDGTNGDYNMSNDMIRMGSRKDKFVSTLLHELGHRWRYKFAGAKQISAFRRAFSDANGRGVSLNKGDVFEFVDGRKYKYLGLFSRSTMLVEKLGENKKYLLKSISKRSIVRINGEEVQKFQFPTVYSRTDVDEFIAECFELYCLGKLQDQKLKEFVEAQLA